MEDIKNVKRGLECRKNADKRCANPCEETGNCPYAKTIRGLDGEPYKPFVCDKEKLIDDTLAVIEDLEERIAIMSESDDTGEELPFLYDDTPDEPCEDDEYV